MTSVFQIAKAQWDGQRKGQEDTCDFRVLGSPASNGQLGAEYSSERFVAVLADGMGGHVGGRRASSLASAAFLESFCRGSEQLDERFSIAVEQGNRLIAQEVAQNPDLKGMGCTLVGAYLDGNMLRWISVGDSIVYVYHADGGWVEKVNDDHSMAPILRKAVERGEISEAEAQNHPHRHALRSALTGGKISLIDPGIKVELGYGDVVVLASDGLLSLSKDDVARIIGASRFQGAAFIAEALIKEVQAKGRADQDNTSVIVAKRVSLSANDRTMRLPTPSSSSSTARQWPRARLALSGLVVAMMLFVVIVVWLAIFFGEPESVANPTPPAHTAQGETDASGKSQAEAPPSSGLSGGAANSAPASKPDDKSKPGQPATQSATTGKTTASSAETGRDKAAKPQDQVKKEEAPAAAGKAAPSSEAGKVQPLSP